MVTDCHFDWEVPWFRKGLKIERLYIWCLGAVAIGRSCWGRCLWLLWPCCRWRRWWPKCAFFDDACKHNRHIIYNYLRLTVDGRRRWVAYIQQTFHRMQSSQTLTSNLAKRLPGWNARIREGAWMQWTVNSQIYTMTTMQLADDDCLLPCCWGIRRSADASWQKVNFVFLVFVL